MAPKKTMTIEDLAKLMKQGFSKADTDTDKKIDNLAVMVQQGFEEVHADISDLKTDISRLDGRMDNIETRMDSLELKIDGVRSIIVVEHGKRIEKLEKAVFLGH